jgi:hypothetical protein
MKTVASRACVAELQHVGLWEADRSGAGALVMVPRIGTQPTRSAGPPACPGERLVAVSGSPMVLPGIAVPAPEAARGDLRERPN